MCVYVFSVFWFIAYGLQLVESVGCRTCFDMDLQAASGAVLIREIPGRRPKRAKLSDFSRVACIDEGLLDELLNFDFAGLDDGGSVARSRDAVNKSHRQINDTYLPVDPRRFVAMAFLGFLKGLLDEKHHMQYHLRKAMSRTDISTKGQLMGHIREMFQSAKGQLSVGESSLIRTLERLYEGENIPELLRLHDIEAGADFEGHVGFAASCGKEKCSMWAGDDTSQICLSGLRQFLIKTRDLEGVVRSLVNWPGHENLVDNLLLQTGALSATFVNGKNDYKCLSSLGIVGVGGGGLRIKN